MCMWVLLFLVRSSHLFSPQYCMQGFEMEVQPGRAVFYLMREYEGESVVVEVDLYEQPSGEDADEVGVCPHIVTPSW